MIACLHVAHSIYNTIKLFTNFCYFFIYLFCVHQIYLQKNIKNVYCNLLDYQIILNFLVVNKLKSKISKTPKPIFFGIDYNLG